MTVSPLFANNASSRLNAAIDDSQTSIIVNDGSMFPDPVALSGDWFMVTVEDRRTGDLEIMKCTARSGNLFTVVRAQEGTTGVAFSEYATVSNRMTAGTMEDYFNYAYDMATADLRFVNVTGDTMTGALHSHRALSDDPTPTELTNRDYVDRRVATIPQITISSAQSLVYEIVGTPSSIDLLDLDIYGQSWILDQNDVEPIDVFINGIKKVENNIGGIGHYDVDAPNNQIDFDAPLAPGDLVAIDIYAPRTANIGVVTMNKVKPLVGIDGVETVFELRVLATNALIDCQKDEDLFLYVDNVQQVPTEDYTALGSVLTFTIPPSADSEVWANWVNTAPAP